MYMKNRKSRYFKLKYFQIHLFKPSELIDLSTYVVKKDDLGSFLWDSTEMYVKTSNLFMFAYPLETTYLISTYCNLFINF